MLKCQQLLSYFLPELIAIDEEKLNTWVEEHDGLSLYKQEFEEVNKQRPHVLPAEQEALLAQLSEVTGKSSETFSMLNNADLKFPKVKNDDGEEVELSHGRYIGFLESDNPSVREDAFKAMYSTYKKFSNTFASTLSGNVKRDNVNATIRNYTNATRSSNVEQPYPRASLR